MKTPEQLQASAEDKVGKPLRGVLVGVPVEEQIEALIKLSATLACMTAAARRAAGVGVGRGGTLYDEAAEAACDILADFISGAGLAGHKGEG